MADQKETIFSITGQEKNVIDVSTSSVNSSSNTEGNNSIYVNDECHSMYFIWKDVLIISLGFLCNFIAFNGLSNVQSSLNSNEGLGSASLGVIYAALIISSFILPSMLVKRFGCKWTMVVCIPFYTLYMLANFYATWYTLMPASVLVGLAAAPLWSSKCSCLTTLSHHYAKLSGEAPEVVNARFFGVFFMILHFDQIIGNLISSFALNSPNDVSSSLLYSFDICGISYCNENLDINVSTTMNNSSGLVTRNRPPLSQIYLMCGIYAALSLSGAVIIALFVRPLKNFQSSTSDLEGLALFKASLYHTINPLQLMMVPLTIFSGLAQSYMTSDFTKVTL